MEKELSLSPLVVLRVVLIGVSELASKLEQDREQLRNECLSIAQRYNGGAIWVESMRLQVNGNVAISSEPSQHDDFSSEVLAALQPSRLAITFARENWGADVEKLLKELSAQQRQEIEALLPDSPDVDALQDVGASDSLQQSLVFEPDNSADAHPFLNELRNLAMSALNWSEDNSNREASEKSSSPGSNTRSGRER